MKSAGMVLIVFPIDKQGHEHRKYMVRSAEILCVMLSDEPHASLLGVAKVGTGQSVRIPPPAIVLTLLNPLIPNV